MTRYFSDITVQKENMVPEKYTDEGLSATCLITIYNKSHVSFMCVKLTQTKSSVT